MKTTKNFVLIGKSGSGKGTQADLLMKSFGNLYYISTGELFRNLAKRDTATSRKIEKVLLEGGLPFDDLATTLWMHEIAFNVRADQGFILDGAPRRPEEAQNLDRFLEFLNWQKNTYHLLIDVSREEAIGRMMERKRNDDTPKAINSRLDYYDSIVTEMIKYYEDRGRLIRINGEQGIEDVHKDIIEAVS